MFPNWEKGIFVSGIILDVSLSCLAELTARPADTNCRIFRASFCEAAAFNKAIISDGPVCLSFRAFRDAEHMFGDAGSPESLTTSDLHAILCSLFQFGSVCSILRAPVGGLRST